MASQPFDRWAPTYEQSPMQIWLFGQVHRAVLRELAALPPPHRVVDIGCGTGRLLRQIQARWPRSVCIGIDPSSAMIEVARNLSEGIVFQASGAELLPMPAESADVVTTTISFHHWSDRSQGMREIARVLRPAGTLVLVDLAGPRWLSAIMGDPLYARKAEREQLLREHGLDLVYHRSIRHPYIMATVARKPSPGGGA